VYKSALDCFSIFAAIFFGRKTHFPFDCVYDFIASGKNYFRDLGLTYNFFYVSNHFAHINKEFQFKNINQETAETSRYLKFANPVFKYDYKSGDYFPKLYKEVYTHLFSSVSDLTSAVRTSP
jgi:hypothetical protein